MIVNPRHTLNLAHVLAEVRRATHVTQLELARRIGRPQSFVSKVETAGRQLEVHDFISMIVACNAHVEVNFGPYEIVVGLHDALTTDCFNVEPGETYPPA